MRGNPFFFPDIEGRVYFAGPQPNAPGETVTPGWPGAVFHAIPWPGAVPVLNVLANNAGTPRNRAPVPVVNNYAQLPMNYLFISGIVEKSQG